MGCFKDERHCGRTATRRSAREDEDKERWRAPESRHTYGSMIAQQGAICGRVCLTTLPEPEQSARRAGKERKR